ncbi:unnamed protein product, partial [Coregonus sp. 'balchen']
MAKKSTTINLWTILLTTSVGVIWGNLASAEHHGSPYGYRVSGGLGRGGVSPRMPGRQGRSPQPTVPPETLIIPAHAPRVQLSQTDIRKLRFKPTVGSVHLSEGHEAKFNCSIDVPDANLDLTVLWRKNNMELAENLQVVINELQTVTHGIMTLLSTVSITRVQRADAGDYRCRLRVNDKVIESQPISIQVEGLPTFTRQPDDRNVTRNSPFNLSCEAVGVDKYTQFSCEAHNQKGVTTSREANVNIKVIQRESNKLVLRWTPGHDGFSPLTTCQIRVKEVSRRRGEVRLARIINATAPPFQSDVPGLQAMTWYNMSVSLPSVYPRNLTVMLNESMLVIRWKDPPPDRVNGILTGYDVIVTYGTRVNKIRSSSNTAAVALQEFNTTYSVQVAACTQAGRGMLSPAVGIFVPENNWPLAPSSSPDTRGSDSVYIILGVVCGFCLLLLVLWAAICMRGRILDTHFGQMFGSGEKLQPIVQYRPHRSYNRSAIEITREFGSVVEGNLKQLDGTSEKVAVKTMK